MKLKTQTEIPVETLADVVGYLSTNNYPTRNLSQILRTILEEFASDRCIPQTHDISSGLKKLTEMHLIHPCAKRVKKTIDHPKPASLVAELLTRSLESAEETEEEKNETT